MHCTLYACVPPDSWRARRGSASAPPAAPLGTTKKSPCQVPLFYCTAGHCVSGPSRSSLAMRQVQHLHAMAAEVDLRTGVVAAALDVDDHTLAELAVRDGLADAPAGAPLLTSARSSARWLVVRPAGPAASRPRPTSCWRTSATAPWATATSAIPPATHRRSATSCCSGSGRAACASARKAHVQALWRARVIATYIRRRSSSTPSVLARAALVREQAFFQAGDEDVVELQPLGRVHRHHLHALPGRRCAWLSPASSDACDRKADSGDITVGMRGIGVEDLEAVFVDDGLRPPVPAALRTQMCRGALAVAFFRTRTGLPR